MKIIKSYNKNKWCKIMKRVEKKEKKKEITDIFHIFNCSYYWKNKKMASNPWDVPNLEEFLYYCCPECNHKIKGDIN